MDIQSILLLSIVIVVLVLLISRLILPRSSGNVDSELATLSERLRNREEQLLELKDITIPRLEAVLREKESELQDALANLSDVREKLSSLEVKRVEELKSAQEKLRLLDEAQQKLSDTFKALSSDALKQNSSSFLELAKTSLEKFQEGAKGDLEQRQKSIQEVVTPLKDSLEKFQTQINVIEKGRLTDYTSLTEQLKHLSFTGDQLKLETANLVKALRKPTVRGRWGEMQLKRVVELVGMLEYCDFVLQESVDGESGRLRPDMVVKLPNHRCIVVDSKVPLAAFLEALEANSEDERQARLQHHAKQVRDHLMKLSSKSYWEEFSDTPEFVVLFLPGESFFSAALEQDPQLLEFGVSQRVIVATPTTLIALLRSVAYGWRQEKLAENAQIISELGTELYKRCATLATHLEDLRKNIVRSVESFNKVSASLESRVFVQARKFRELGAAPSDDPEDTISEIAPIDNAPRILSLESYPKQVNEE